MGGVVSKHTATENARYIARLYALDPDYIESFCRWLCGIEEYFDRPVGTYSSGMRARFNFALMLALEFDIYLIDEGMPSTTDVEFNRKAGVILRQRLQNATVIIVSHQPKTLEKFCRSAAVLKNGQLYMFETLQEAKALYDYELTISRFRTRKPDPVEAVPPVSAAPSRGQAVQQVQPIGDNAFMPDENEDGFGEQASFCPCRPPTLPPRPVHRPKRLTPSGVRG